MDTSTVENDLNSRFEAAIRLWHDGSPMSLRPMKVKRGPKEYDCKVEIVGLVNRPQRKSEKRGLQFKLSLPTDQPVFTAEIEVGIKPQLTEGDSTDSPPYVAVYRTIPRIGDDGASKTSIFWEQYLRADEYESFANLVDEEWFLRFS